MPPNYVSFLFIFSPFQCFDAIDRYLRMDMNIMLNPLIVCERHFDVELIIKTFLEIRSNNFVESGQIWLVMGEDVGNGFALIDFR